MESTVSGSRLLSIKLVEQKLSAVCVLRVAFKRSCCGDVEITSGVVTPSRAT